VERAPTAADAPGPVVPAPRLVEAGRVSDGFRRPDGRLVDLPILHRVL
jgi:hypothetical protein